MIELMTDVDLSTQIDNELLLGEVSDNSYEFEDDMESTSDWNNEIIRGK